MFVKKNFHFLHSIDSYRKKYRVIIGVMYAHMSSVGCGFLGLAAYYVRDWRTLQLIDGVPMFIP